jgi:hypothetical protein
MSRTWIMRVTAGIVTMVVAIAVMATPASAIIIVNGQTGLFGVTADQTIRVSILNASAKGGIAPCVGVFDVNGVLLAEIEGGPVRPGAGTFVDFDAATLGDRNAPRRQVRVEVEFNLTPDDGQPPDPAQPPDPIKVRARNIILTLEVVDNATGKTSFVMPWRLAGFNPQPEPPRR